MYAFSLIFKIIKFSYVLKETIMILKKLLIEYNRYVMPQGYLHLTQFWQKNNLSFINFNISQKVINTVIKNNSKQKKSFLSLIIFLNYHLNNFIMS